MSFEKVLKVITIALILIGALNWGLVGAFHFNLVSALLGELSVWTRLVYILVGLAGLYKIFLLAMGKMKK